MRFGIYTSIISIGEFTIIFEALSGKFVVLKNISIDNSADSISQLESLYKEVFDKLVQAEILVDEDTIEVETLQQRIREIDNNEEIFFLNVNPTLDCNFHCWYCYENHVAHSEMSDEVLQSVVKFANRTIRQNEKLKQFHLGFFGGEPLLKINQVVNPLISGISSMCKDNDVAFSVSFTTNGFLITDSFIEYIKNYAAHFQITLDGGREYHDRTRFQRKSVRSYDAILDNVIKLLSNNIRVTLRINYTSKNVDSIESILNDLVLLTPEMKQYLTMDFQRVWQEREPKEDINEEKVQTFRSLFIQKGFNVSANYIQPVYDTCYGNCSNHVLINFNGEAFGCTARDFTHENSIGQIKPDGVIEYEQPKRNDRLSSRFSKEVCKTCRIAPYCGGGCAQRAYEATANDRCIYGYDEEDIDNMILKLFDQTYCSTPDGKQ